MKTTWMKLTTAALACGLVITGGVAASAQGSAAQNPTATQQPAAKHHGGHGMAGMAKKLGLTDDQKTQIKGIMATTRDQVKSIRADAQLSAADKKAKVKALHTSTRTQIEAVLTPEQLAKWKQMKKDHRRDGADQKAEKNA